MDGGKNNSSSNNMTNRMQTMSLGKVGNNGADNKGFAVIQTKDLGNGNTTQLVGGLKLTESDSVAADRKKFFHSSVKEGKEVKRLYIEEASDIKKEFYLSCLVDRASSNIAFISSTEGGVDIEKVAAEKPEQIITNKIDFKNEIENNEIERIIKPFDFNDKQKLTAHKLIKALYKILIEKDATLIEINPLIITKDERIVCLDAKMNFDDNALFRQPEILQLRDLNEEEPAEIEASKYDLAYIKLNGSIGCMVNGAGLAMATMDIIKQSGGEPANFLDVGGTADADRVEKAFNIILKDTKVKGILVNIFGGIVRCDRVANGVVQAYKSIGNIPVPIIVRLQGTNAVEAKEIIDNSGLNVHSAITLKEAAEKVKDLVG